MSGGKTVFELRVHGVSGTPPEAMLSCPKEFIEQVAGDANAGFFRRSEWVDRAATPPDQKKWWRRMEAYSWGGLTSRKATRAIWLLFLPFSLINLAHWMLPPVSRPRPAIVVVVLLRLLALSFTLTLLLSMAAAVLDITVWQCTSIDYCSAGWGPLALIGSWPMGWRILIGALPLVAVIAVLWWLGREETTRDDERSAATMGVAEAELLNNKPPPPGPVVTPRMRSPLTRRTFWNRDDAVQRMRACHVTAWTAGLSSLVLLAPVREAHTGAVGAINIVLLVVNLGLLCAAIVATASPEATGRGGRTAPAWIQDGVNAARWIAFGLVVVTLLWIARSFKTDREAGPSSLPGLHNSLYGLVLVQAVLLVAVFIGIAMARPQLSLKKGFEPTLKGRTAGYIAILGWLLGGGLSAAVGLWTAQTLGTWVYSSEAATDKMARRTELLGSTDIFHRISGASEPAPLIVPPAYVWASVATIVVLLAAAAAVIRLLVTLYRQRTLDAINKVANEREIEKCAPPDVLKRITRSRRFATLTDRGPSLIASLVIIACALVLLAAVLLYISAAAFVDEWVQGRIGELAAGATVSLVILFFTLVVSALRNRHTRRLVAILWDVITFWPRANHPLTPPSYGGRTVFDLRLRMRELVDATAPTRVVVVAHSQGTVIAAAALMQMKEPKERYPLLTFGSPLRRLYARNFPAYFGWDTLCRLRNFHSTDDYAPKMPRWINLWALTDPIGSWAFTYERVYIEVGHPPKTMAEMLAGVDCRVFDVQQIYPKVGDYDVSRDGTVCGHSGFWSRGEYATAVGVLHKLVAPDSAETVDATAPPTERGL